jgi:2-oxoglutarate ferredoxin oxidoreductase subunit beta
MMSQPIALRWPIFLVGCAYPQFPEPIGVFRSVERPIYDEQINQQVEQAIAERGVGTSKQALYEWRHLVGYLNRI